MKITPAPLQGLLIIEPDVHADDRGYFLEVLQQERYREYGLPTFVQDNLSRSIKNVVRGFHYQKPKAQAKLVWAVRGAVWDVVIDIRTQSKTFGQWFGITLSDENHLQLYIPEGFAHGFCVLSEEADFYYKCSDFYSPQSERGIAWNDKALSVPWPVSTPLLSLKDEQYPPLNEVPDEHLFN